MEVYCYLCGVKLKAEESRAFGIGPICYEKICKWEAISTIHRKIANPTFSKDKYMNTDLILEKEYHRLYSFYQNNPEQRRADFKMLEEDEEFKKEREGYEEIKGLHIRRLKLTDKINKIFGLIKSGQLSKTSAEFQDRMSLIRSLFEEFENLLAYRLMIVKREHSKRYVDDLVKQLKKEKLILRL